MFDRLRRLITYVANEPEPVEPARRPSVSLAQQVVIAALDPVGSR